MAKNATQTNEVVNTEADELKTATMALDNTSKKIRFLASKGKSTKEIYKLINEYGVTTKDGGEIRYQHVRNVLHTILSSK